MAKADKKPDVFLRRTLNVQQAGDVTLLDAIAHPDGENRTMQLFELVRAPDLSVACAQ